MLPARGTDSGRSAAAANGILPDTGSHPLPPLGGFAPFSTVDYPGYLCAVIYTQGCPCRCRYCHNPHLQQGRGHSNVSWPAFMSWLATRKGLLDAVAFCGGEPTVHKSLQAALRKVRNLGFSVALHTSGIYPYNFSQMLPYIDWVGFDIKAPLARYADVTGVPGSGIRVQNSVECMLFSNVAYEIRTTVHPAILDAADLVTIARWLKLMGISNWVLQSFNPAGCVNMDLITSYAPIHHQLLDKLREHVPNILVR